MRRLFKKGERVRSKIDGKVAMITTTQQPQQMNFGFNGHQAPPPLAGQKRGFPFSGRGGGSPGEFYSLFLLFSCLVCGVVATEN